MFRERVESLIGMMPKLLFYSVGKKNVQFKEQRNVANKFKPGVYRSLKICLG